MKEPCRAFIKLCQEAYVLATCGATVAAGAIGTSVAATEIATMATLSTVVTSGGCMAAAMAQVEAASMGVAAFGLWLPLP